MRTGLSVLLLVALVAYAVRHHVMQRIRPRLMWLGLKWDGHHRAARMAKGWTPPLGMPSDEVARVKANLLRRFPG